MMMDILRKYGEPIFWYAWSVISLLWIDVFGIEDSIEQMTVRIIGVVSLATATIHMSMIKSKDA